MTPTKHLCIRQTIVRWFIKVRIARWVEDYQPGIVECELIDRLGKRSSFTIKLPVVTTEQLSSASEFPREGYLPCVAIASSSDDAGRDVIVVDTSLPLQEEADGGNTRFEVFADQVIETPRGYDDLAEPGR